MGRRSVAAASARMAATWTAAEFLTSALYFSIEATMISVRPVIIIIIIIIKYCEVFSHTIQ